MERRLERHQYCTTQPLRRDSAFISVYSNRSNIEQTAKHPTSTIEGLEGYQRGTADGQKTMTVRVNNLANLH